MAGKIKLWSTTPGNNNSAPPNGWPEGMAPSAVNNTARQDRASVAEWYQDAEWIDYGHTIVTAAGQDYTISGDVTAIYRVGRAIRQNLSSAAIGIITNSVFSTPNTLVTVSGYVPSAAPTSVEVGAADRATSRLSAGTSAVDFATFNGNIQYKVNNVTVGLMTSTGLNAVNIGATTPGTAAFTTLAATTITPTTISGGTIDGSLLANIASGSEIGPGTGPAELYLDGGSASNKLVRFRTGGVNRWTLGTDSTAESGSSAGSNFVLNAHDDAGVSASVISAARAAGGAINIGRPVGFGANLVQGTNFNIAGGTVSGATITVNDNALSIRDQTDTTKVAQFECSNITTATTRIYTLPNASDTIAVLAATQTLTNKTLGAGTAITAGTISGITDLAVADGGTGASTAAAARTNLGVAIGSDVQAYDAGLAALAAFNTNGILVQTADNTFAGRTLTGPAAGITVTNGAGTAGNPTLALANDLAALEGLASTGIAVRSAADTWVQRTITGAAAGVTVSNGDGVSGNPTLALADDLAAIEALATTGLAARTGTSTWAARTLTGPAAGISVTNGDGVAGNPTLALANDLAALEALASTGIAARTGTDTWAQRTITGTTNEIDVTNGNGVSGNPTIGIAAGVRRLIATGSIDNTSLSITVAANSYTRLFLVVAGWYHSTTSWLPYIRVNNNAVSSSYYSIVIDANVNAQSGFHGSSNNDVVRLKAGGGLIESGQANAFGAEISFFNPNRVSENKAFNIQSSMNLESNGIYTANDIQRCRVLATAVISSIQLYTRSTNTANLPATTLTPTGGTYYLYGE